MAGWSVTEMTRDFDLSERGTALTPQISPILLQYKEEPQENKNGDTG